MKLAPPLLALAASFAAAVAIAGPVLSVERAIETGSGVVLMPTSENGTLTANNCGNCRSERLTVTPTTRYYARDQAVSLTVLRTLLAGSPNVSMTVLVDPKSATVLRVIADIAPPRAQNR